MNHDCPFVYRAFCTSILFITHFHPMVVAIAAYASPVATWTTIQFWIGGLFLFASLGIHLVPYGAVAIPRGIDELVLWPIEGTTDIDTSVGHFVGVSGTCGESSLIVIYSALCLTIQCGKCQQGKSN